MLDFGGNILIKLVVTDIDGTLVNDEKKLHDDFDSVIEKLAAKDIKFCIASGRHVTSIERMFSHIKDDILFISSNGAYVSFKGYEIYSMPVSYDACVEITNLFESFKDGTLLYSGKRKVYIKKCDKKYYELITPYLAEFEYVDSIDDVPEEILELSILDIGENGKNSLKLLESAKRDDIKISVSGFEWIDIININIDKGVAVKKIQELYDFKFEECMAFGDNYNDIEMLESVYHSYAMENADNEVKKHARYVAKSNNMFGVIEVLKTLID